MSWGTAAAIGATALASLASSFFGRKSSTGTSLSNTSGRQILGTLQGLTGQTQNPSVWSKLLDTFKSMNKNVGIYANSAYDYFMEDLAFQKQVDYNLKAMAKEFDYSKQSMAEQYKYDTAMQDRSYDYSRSLQNEQNDWSKMMSDTSHQREVADLRNAGLNPILSANGGATAYTSGGAILGGNTPTPNSGVTAKGVDRPHYGSIMDKMLTATRIENETNEANARINKLNQETQNLKWTKEGLLSQGADILQGLPGIIEGITDGGLGYNTNTSVKIATGLGSMIGGLVNNLIDKLKSHGSASDGRSYKWIDDNVINQIGSLLSNIRNNNIKSPQIIHTKYGDLEDIDSYIRKTYNVNRKVE